MKKFILAIIILTLSNGLFLKAIDDKPKWMFLRDKLIYSPKRTAFTKAMLSNIASAPLYTLPLAIFKLKAGLFFITFFGSSYLWLRYWRTSECKSEFMKFLYNWNDHKEKTPEECHEQFDRLSNLLRTDPVKFNEIYLVELESIQIQISSHINT